MSEPVERRLMTPEEMQAVERMGVVTYPVASWDKRFMRSLSSCETISEKESAQLWRLFIRYRRQMSFPDKQRLLGYAQGKAAPDLRKLAAEARKQQAALDKLNEYRRLSQAYNNEDATLLTSRLCCGGRSAAPGFLLLPGMNHREVITGFAP